MEKYNCMTVLYILPGSRKDKYGAGKKCVCRCDCGRLFKRPYRNITNNKIKMCKECSNNLKKQQKHHSTHNKTHTRLYSIYHGMKNRCYNKNQIAYQKWYGNRGIKICKEWEKSFDSFYQWAINNGYQQGLSIDRIDNSKDYCQDNCRFVNAHTQVANRRILKNNKTGYTGVEIYQPKLWKAKKPYTNN